MQPVGGLDNLSTTTGESLANLVSVTSLLDEARENMWAGMQGTGGNQHVVHAPKKTATKIFVTGGEKIFARRWLVTRHTVDQSNQFVAVTSIVVLRPDGCMYR